MADLQRKTANLFDGELEKGVWDSVSTLVQTTSEVFRSFKRNLPAGTYTLSFPNSVNIVRLIADGTLTTNLAINVNSYTVTTTTDGDIGFSFRLTTSSTTPWDNENVMLNAGQTALPYEPYGWVHSLRKLTTATETVENPLYSDGTAITSYIIKGNTVQDGTPTPSNPVEVNGVGERTENLLDYSFFTSTRYVTVTPITNGINLTGIYFAEINGINLDVGTTYYMSWNAEIISGDTYVAWRVQYTDDSYSPQTQSGSALTIAKEVAKILFYINSNNTQASVNITNLMFNSGSTALPYEPYGYFIEIEVS